MNNMKKTVKTFSFMIALTLVGKILGLGRTLLFANYYGTTNEASAFNTASIIPMSFFEFVFGAIVTLAFIPVFNDYLKNKNKKEANKFANNFLNISLIISAGVVVLGIFLSPVLVKLFSPGINQETYELTVKLTKILFPMMIFAVSAFVFVGILQSFNEFNIPASISIISNLILIGYLFIFNKYYGLTGLAIAMVIGWFAQMAIQIPFALKDNRFRYKFYVNFKDEGINKVFLMSAPVVISTWVQPITNLVNTRLSSFVSDNAYSVLKYANDLYIIIVGVFTLAVGNFIFPSLSRSGMGKEYGQFTKTIKNALKAIVYFMFPLTVGLIVLRVPLLQIMYERNKFTHESTLMTSIPLFFYAFGMLGYGVREVMNKAFYSLEDPKTPMKVAVIGIILNVLLSYIFVQFLGLGGLALAVSISTTFIAALLIIIFQKRKFKIWNAQSFVYLIKVGLSSVIMGIIVVILKNQLANILVNNTFVNKLLLLIIPTGIGLLIYLVSTYLLKLQEPRMALQLFFHKSGQKSDKE